jgi:FixJ family two-component response regulator
MQAEAVSELRRSALISIVDDDELVREALGRLMKANGYLAQTFDSGASLLSSERLADTACLITDVQMPGMTGVELHARLIAAGTPIPTILITGHPDEAARVRALQAGVIAYLTKPISGADLLSSVRSAIETREANGRSE